MPNYRRAKIGGGTYFFTVCSRQRQPILTSSPIREAIRDALSIVREDYPFQIDAWVLLPDHLHCIWTLPPGDSDYSKRWSKVKRLVSQRCRPLIENLGRSRSIRNESGIWQRRFWEHFIQSEEDYRTHIDYIHWNPVKHGHASRAICWRYSSFRRYVMDGLCEQDWGIDERTFEERGFGE